MQSQMLCPGRLAPHAARRTQTDALRSTVAALRAAPHAGNRTPQAVPPTGVPPTGPLLHPPAAPTLHPCPPTPPTKHLLRLLDAANEAAAHSQALCTAQGRVERWAERIRRDQAGRHRAPPGATSMAPPAGLPGTGACGSTPQQPPGKQQAAPAPPPRATPQRGWAAPPASGGSQLISTAGEGAPGPNPLSRQLTVEHLEGGELEGLGGSAHDNVLACGRTGMGRGGKGVERKEGRPFDAALEGQPASAGLTSAVCIPSALPSALRLTEWRASHTVGVEQVEVGAQVVLGCTEQGQRRGWVGVGVWWWWWCVCVVVVVLGGGGGMI